MYARSASRGIEGELVNGKNGMRRSASKWVEGYEKVLAELGIE